MAIKNLKLGGTDWVDAEVLEAVDQNDTFDAAVNITAADQTGGSIGNSTTETMLGEVILPAGTAIGGVLVIVTGKVTCPQVEIYSANTGSIKLYSGTNAGFGDNDVRKTISRAPRFRNNISNGGFTLIYTLTSEETWTGEVYIQVTGKNSGAHGDSRVQVESLVVIPIGGSV